MKCGHQAWSRTFWSAYRHGKERGGQVQLRAFAKDEFELEQSAKAPKHVERLVLNLPAGPNAFGETRDIAAVCIAAGKKSWRCDWQLRIDCGPKQPLATSAALSSRMGRSPDRSCSGCGAAATSKRIGMCFGKV